ncbi:MAG: hypothetical protein M1831_001215 [Alyxoria varia]|nr:MAG: hypothetical protein M1831_001215 [Alyxoria varia]
MANKPPDAPIRSTLFALLGGGNDILFDPKITDLQSALVISDIVTKQKGRGARHLLILDFPDSSKIPYDCYIPREEQILLRDYTSRLSDKSKSLQAKVTSSKLTVFLSTISDPSSHRNTITTELVLEQAGWGAKNGINFDIIAYSSGAPIALEYCNRHGADVRFVALIGPAGVSKQIQGPCDNLLFKAFLKQPSLVPQQLLRNRIAKLLGVKDTTKTPEQSRKSLERVGAEDAQDGLDRYMSNSPGWSPLAPRQVSHIDDAVSYQIMHHDGFLYHVCSALRDGPVAHQKTIYRTAFRAFRNSRNLIKTPEQRDLTVFLAEDDKSARPKDVKALMEQIFGPATLESFDRYCRIQNLDGGHHHMPTRECDMIFDTLSETWF